MQKKRYGFGNAGLFMALAAMTANAEPVEAREPQKRKKYPLWAKLRNPHQGAKEKARRLKQLKKQGAIE